MKRVLLASICLMVPATVAHAADPPPVIPPVVAPIVVAQPAPLWPGFYVGVHAGVGFFYAVEEEWPGYCTTEEEGFDYECDIGGDEVEYREYEPRGSVFGLHAGVNMQRGGLVFGAEADFTWVNEADTVVGGGPGGGNAREFTVRWLSTARLRAGFAFDRILVYATGGFAVAQIGTWKSVGGGPSISSALSIETGYVLGLGVEALVRDNIVVRGEYLYVNLGRSVVGVFDDGPTSIHGHVIRGGVSFLFGG